MELTEEKELKSIIADFTKAVEAFKKKTYPQAQALFDKIIEQNKDSRFDSVLKVKTSAMAYRNICEAQIKPVKIELTCDEDYLFDGMYFLNAGKLDKARERFHYLEQKQYPDPYLNYLLAIYYLKKRDTDSCLNQLRKAIQKDRSYQVIAHNDVDFDRLSEHEAFVSLVESGI
jgi:hypothetical protein